MPQFRIIDRPAFEVIGKKTWISGQDNDLFGIFWEECKAEGLFGIFEQISGFQPGSQTNGVTLGISQVEKDPADRAFYYMIAIEKTKDCTDTELESYQVPSAIWAVFECRGRFPPRSLKQKSLRLRNGCQPPALFTHRLLRWKYIWKGPMRTIISVSFGCRCKEKERNRKECAHAQQTLSIICHLYCFGSGFTELSPSSRVD